MTDAEYVAARRLLAEDISRANRQRDELPRRSTDGDVLAFIGLAWILGHLAVGVLAMFVWFCASTTYGFLWLLAGSAIVIAISAVWAYLRPTRRTL